MLGARIMLHVLPAAAIVPAGQYYNLIRLGREGYTDIMHAIQGNAGFVRQRLVDSGWFADVAKAPGVPVVCIKLKNRPTAAPGGDSGSGSGGSGSGKPLLFTVYEVSERLREHGWIVPVSASVRRGARAIEGMATILHRNHHAVLLPLPATAILPAGVHASAPRGAHRRAAHRRPGGSVA